MREVPELRVLAWGIAAGAVAFVVMVVPTGILTALDLPRRTTQGLAEAFVCPAMLLALLGGLLVLSAMVMALGRVGGALRAQLPEGESAATPAPRGPYRSSAEAPPGPDLLARSDRRTAIRMAVLGAILLAVGYGLTPWAPYPYSVTAVRRLEHLRFIGFALEAVGGLLTAGALHLAWRSRSRS